MGCLYYIPARRFPGGKVPDVVKGDALAEFGLAHLAGAALTHRGVRNSGPDGGAGLVVGLGVSAGETGVFKAEQEWQPVRGGDLWLGWKASSVPGPEVFLRGRALAARASVMMGDGNEWGFTPTRALPERLGMTDAGEEAWLPCPEYSEHYAASAWLMDYLVAMEDAPLLDVVDRVVCCLATRYHISRLEVAVLGLYREDLNLRIICACLGLDWDAVVKKKAEMAAA